MKRTLISIVSGLLVLALGSPASAQLLAAKDGPIVYGHHHLNATSIDEHKKFYRKIPAIDTAIAFTTDPWGASIELSEGLDKIS